MKKLILLLTIFISVNAYAQTEPILGLWNFELKHKINNDTLFSNAEKIGVDLSNNLKKASLFNAVAVFIIKRCEYSEIMFSEYSNTVLITKKNFYDNTIVTEIWGVWEKQNNNIYKLKFDGDYFEYYFFNTETNHFYLTSAGVDNRVLTKLLENNFRLKKYKN